jgi:hypothetical protein
LAIPVFVRSRLDRDKEFLEFATALNVSAGGMLIALRHSLPAETEISLEIPSAPLSDSALLPVTTRALRATVLRTQLGHTFHLVGLKFSQPLLKTSLKSGSVRSRKRERLSSV